MKALYKSQINLGDLIVWVALYMLFVFSPIWESVESDTNKWMLICSVPIICCVVWSIFINKFYFYDEKIKIVYLLRFFNREKNIKYSDIKEIRYINTAGSKQPMVELIYLGKSHSIILLPSNSFTHRYFKKRIEILFFLHRKGIPIIINSVFKKDEKAFANIPNVTIQK